MTALRQRMLEDLQIRHYSKTTIRLYLHAVTVFSQHFGKPPDQLGPEAIRSYQVYLTNEKKLAPAPILIAVSALRFLYNVTLHKGWNLEDIIPAPKKPQRLPIVLSPEEVRHFLSCVASPKYRTILTTCYAAGLRISEALHLLVSDITADGLLIRRTKFQKTRLVPLHETAVAGLGSYLMCRQEMRRGGDHVFVSNEGQPLVYWKVHSVFRTLLKSAGLKPSGGRWPRIHELRHTFAVRALESSPTGRQRVGRHMLALATYLGHVNIDATYWYLETTPELLRDIADVAENFVQRRQP